MLIKIIYLSKQIVFANTLCKNNILNISVNGIFIYLFMNILRLFKSRKQFYNTYIDSISSLFTKSKEVISCQLQQINTVVAE